MLASQELLDRARRGDREAFDDLVGIHVRELRAHCYRMLGVERWHTSSNVLLKYAVRR